MSENNLNIPYFGMQLGKNPMDLKPEEYSVMVNGNIESFDTSPIKVTNESSNILCSQLKPNFQITGILPVNPLKRVYYFINNPYTNQSEIVYINNAYYENKDDEEINCSTCNSQTKEPTPLEQKEQIPICSFSTFVSDPCLQFNVKEPISATFRINERGLVIFFAQPNKPPRFIEEYDIPYKLIPQNNPSGCTSCGNPQYTNELDCNRIKILKDYEDPCISVEDVVIGGKLKAGVYQFLISYADERQVELTDFSNYSLPVSIYQRNITVDTDYETNKAIKLRISNLSQEFENFKLVVVETLNNISTAYQVGVFPITSSEFIYTYTANNRHAEIQISPNELRRKRPVYTSAKLVTQNNDFLFWAKLKEQSPINLQPVVNNLRIKAATIETFEGFYKNPLSYKYVSYLRDEVVPFAIYFKTKNGYQTADFLISNNDEDYYTSKGVPVNTIDNGINAIPIKGCENLTPNKYWQVYNAAPSGYINLCNYSEEGLKDDQITEEDVCFSEEWTDGDPEPADCQRIDWTTVLPCIKETVIPEGIIKVPTFAKPTRPFPDPLPKPKENQSEDILNDVFYNGYTPLNTSIDNSELLYQGQNNQCGTSTNAVGNTTGGFPRAYFTSGNLINYFKLQISNPIATSIYVTSFDNTPVKIEIYKQDQVTPVIDAVSNTTDPDDYFVIRNATSGINVGETVFIKLTYPPSPSIVPLPPFLINKSGTAYMYANICVTQPISNGEQEINQKAVFRKRCKLTRKIDVKTLKDPTCFTRPAREYDFAYWESSLCYPNNPEVWGDLCGKPIRYHKFPDVKIAPIHSSFTQNNTNLGTKKVRIYPIGIKLDIEDVKSILNQAVQQGLISEQQKLEITSFGIKRGNRRQNKSIIAKGLLYDVWKAPLLNEYKTSVISQISNGQQYEYYPNYPYNSLEDDPFLRPNILNPNPISHPFSSNNYVNNKYTFHSPETSYTNPLLGTEFKIESIEWGLAGIMLSQVDDHAKYVLLTQLAVDVAEALASARIILEVSLSAFSAGSFSTMAFGSGTDLSIIAFFIYLAIGLAAGFIANLDKYTVEQYEIFKNLIQPKNYCYYYYSVGNYDNSSFIQSNTIRQRAGINTAIYLKPGNLTFNDFNENISFNNFQRESSVYLSISNSGLPDTYFQPPNDFTPSGIRDTSRVIIPYENQISYNNIVSYYGSIKNYVPDQYGLPEQIEWVDTGYCGRIDWNNNQSNTCEIIFGGDTYIGRHTLKRKFPYFLQDRVNFPEDTDINFQEIGNIGYPKYWFNSTKTYLDPIRRPKDFARKATSANLFQTADDIDREKSKGLEPGSFIRLGKIFLYQYGICNFICESNYNLDLRHGENDLIKNYYPNILDVKKWTQQKNVPISEDNYYSYNTTYSKQLTENLSYSLKPFYNQKEEDIKTNRINRVLYSKQYNPYSYSANDFFDFDLSDGELTSIKGIEQYAVLVTQTNVSKVFNAFIEIPATPANIQVTTGNIFAQKPRQYYKTDLGYGGATHQQIVSTPYGHFYIDSENPSILQLQGNTQKDITEDTENKKVKSWFRENLPFQIKKQFPEVNVDNPLNNLGIAMGWDNKFNRLFITKLDYKVKSEYLKDVTYSDQTFYYKHSPIVIGDPKYFHNKSWTISYSPKVEQFISFYTFKPNTYISHETYFQTVFNNPIKINNHLQNIQSYQVFGGELHPFIIDYTIKNNYINKQLTSISYTSEFRRYQDNLNYYIVQNKTFNKALIYTNNQTSGYLSLIPRQKNNQFQNLQYLSDRFVSQPPYIYSEILVDNNLNLYTFNKFQDRVNDTQLIKDNQLETQFNTQPILYYTADNPAYKELNPSALSYTPTPFIRTLQNEYFSVRLINDIYSNYRIELQFNVYQTTNIK